LTILLSGCARPRFFGCGGKGSGPQVYDPGLLEQEAARDARFRGPSNARDATAEFTRLFHAGADPLNQERLAILRQHEVLLVHGLLGEVGIGVRGFMDRVKHNQRLLDYQKDQEEALAAHQVAYERVVFRSHTVERSGGKIAQAILAADRPVIILSHSKGCVDTLEALLQLARQGQLQRVRGWIAIQGVFSGSPLAARYVSNGGLRTLGIVAMRALGGDFDAVRDLTPAARLKYHEEHSAEIESLTRSLPILCFASWEELSTTDSPAQADGAEGDGRPLTSAFRIQPESSILAGSTYVAKAGISHSATVVRSGHPYDRRAFTRALLAMLAERMAQPAPTARAGHDGKDQGTKATQGTSGTMDH
jgi:hypothetical protein